MFNVKCLAFSIECPARIELSELIFGVLCFSCGEMTFGHLWFLHLASLCPPCLCGELVFRLPGWSALCIKWCNCGPGMLWPQRDLWQFFQKIFRSYALDALNSPREAGSGVSAEFGKAFLEGICGAPGKSYASDWERISASKTIPSPAQL